MSLAREVTWHPELQQLVFSPLAEQDQLRGASVASVGRRVLAAGSVHVLSDHGEGAQAEVEVTFELPERNASLGVSVMAGADPSTSGMLFFFEFSPRPTLTAQHTITVGSVNLSISSQYAQWMPNKVLPCCGQYGQTNLTNAHSCKQGCAADEKCEAWTFQPIAKRSTGRCTKLKFVYNTAQTMWRPPLDAVGSTSGVRSPSKLLGGKTDTLRLSPHEKTLSLRVYVDNDMAEAFWQHGRVVMTRQAAPTEEAGIALHAIDGAVVEQADVWRVNDIWVAPEAVLRTPHPHPQHQGV